MTLPRRTTLAIVVCGLAATALSVSARSSSSHRSCETLRQWARPFAQTQPTLDELAQHDRARRRAIFNAVTPHVRASLWREQFTRFERSPSLSDEQRQAVQHAITLVTPGMYAGDSAAVAAMDAHWARVEGLFAQHRAAWFDLGSIVRTSTRDASQENWCECNPAYGWLECESGNCVTNACDDWRGCGPSGGHWCTGFCTAAK
jgi:hypothetical protein